jgi:Glycosyltransferase family 87
VVSTFWESNATRGDAGPASDRALSWLLKLFAINGLIFVALTSLFILGGDTARDAIKSTTLKATIQLRHATYDDSWWPMLKTYQAHLNNPDGDMYAVFYDDDVKYQYPPSALLPLELLPQAMTEVAGRTEFDEGLKQTLRFLSLAAVLLTALASVLVLKVGLDRWAPGGAGTTTHVVGFTALGLANALIWYPLIVGFGWGHIQVFLNLLLSLSILAYLLNRPLASGVLLGVCCLVKPHYGLFFVWGLLRKQWTFAGALAATGAAGTLVALLVYGFSDHFSYVHLLSWLSQRGEAIWTNQGLNGLLHRFFENGAAYEVAGQTQSAFPPYHRGVHVLSTIFMLLILALGLLLPQRARGPSGSALDFSTMLVAITVASPIAWVYQYGPLLPVFALALAITLSTRNLPRLFVPLLAVAYLGIGHIILKWEWIFSNPWKGLLLGSQMFFAALLFFGLLLYLCSRQTAAARTV